MSDFLVVLLLPFFIWGGAVLLDRGFSYISSRGMRVLVAVAGGIILILIAALVLGFQEQGGPAPVTMTVAMFLFIVLIAAMAVVTPAPLLDGEVIGPDRVWVMLASSVISLYFIVALLVNPEMWPGGPEPLLSDRVPLVGWLLDGAMSNLPDSGPVPVFSLLVYFGFFIEIVFISTVLFYLVQWAGGLKTRFNLGRA
jgi:hypothetical protein